MDLRKIVYNTCTHPVKLRVFDSASQSYQVKELPCGKCLHCRMTKVSEWCTRLYAASKYVQNVYFATLDYAPFDDKNTTAQLLACETFAQSHSINSNKKLGLHPLLLCKSHLQDFFKRLRKNNNISFQYFACGEYGSRYSRPHYHLIFFSNDVITEDMVQSAWTVNNYRIGNVDFHDLRKNGTFIKNKPADKYSPKNCFLYVCKYLQKGNFDFQKMATIDYVRSIFERDFAVLPCLFQDVKTLSPEDKKVYYDSYKRFASAFAPFVICSKRPAIGLQYFSENAERFQKGDFRLFGLSQDCTIFPNYWVRKTKESLCSLDVLGEVSSRPSSSSRLQTLVSFLRQVVDSDYSIENWTSLCDDFSWRGEAGKLVSVDGSDVNYLSLHVFDRKKRYFYQFNGSTYNVWHVCRGYYDYVNTISLQSALDFFDSECTSLMSKYVRPMSLRKQLRDYILSSSLKDKYLKLCDELNSQPMVDKFRPFVTPEVMFRKELEDVESNMLSSYYTRQNIYNNTKISF